MMAAAGGVSEKKAAASTTRSSEQQHRASLRFALFLVETRLHLQRIAKNQMITSAAGVARPLRLGRRLGGTKFFLPTPNQISTPSSSHCCIIMLVSVYVSCGEKWDRSVVSGVLVSGRCALFLSSSSARPSSPYPSSLANRPLTRTRLSALSLRIWYRMFFLNDRLAFFLLYRSTASFLRSASPRRPCKTSSGEAHEE